MSQQGKAQSVRQPPRDAGRPRAGTVYDNSPVPPQGSARALPGLLGTGLRILWNSGRRELATTFALQLVGGCAMALVVLAGEEVLSGVLTAHGEDGALGDFLPAIAMLLAGTTALGLVRALEPRGGAPPRKGVCPCCVYFLAAGRLSGCVLCINRKGVSDAGRSPSVGLT